MRIAILGTRGIPANYGGFETFAERLSTRLAVRGHDVTVYARNQWVVAGTRTYQGVRVVRLPSPSSKYLETVVHTLMSALHVVGRGDDLVYICNSANLPAAVLLWIAGKRVVLNVDGLEWQRAKWGPPGRAYYRFCAWAAAQLPIEIVTDARVIQTYYSEHYGRETAYFPYGTELEPVADEGTLASLGLQPRQYVLYVSRLEPENNAHVVIEAYRSVRSRLPLVVVGDAPYAEAYIARLHSLADERVVFTGGIYGHGYRVLQSHAAAYVQATEVGGTHPALVESMGYGNAIAANDVPEHREVLGDAGLFYSGSEALASALQTILDSPELAAGLRQRSTERARANYSWDAVTDGYEQWFHEVVRATRRPSHRHAK
jgi:glycosyltransferase involved in cell wall biosynthesis